MIAAVVLFFGLRRTRGATASNTVLLAEPRWSRWIGGGALVVSLVLLAHAWATYEIRPLLEWDGWAIWGTRSRALYEFGGATGPVFTSDVYLPLQHPLLLPSLDAIDFRAMGTYDPTLVHVQLALLAFGFLLGFVSLLRDRVPFALVGAIGARGAERRARPEAALDGSRRRPARVLRRARACSARAGGSHPGSGGRSLRERCSSARPR